MNNPFDADLATIVGAMKDVHADLQATFKGVRPFNSVELSPAESLYLYDNPAQHPALGGEMDPATGLPLTNAQAASALLQLMGPQQYVGWVERNEQYREKGAA